MRRIIFSALLSLVTIFLTQCDESAVTSQAKTLSFDRQSLTPRKERLVVGVGVHFGIGGDYNYVVDKAAAGLKDLGVDSFRDDLPWVAFEESDPAKGVFQPAKVFDFMKATSARPLLILTHPRKMDGIPPLDAGAQAAYADFAARAVAATRSFDPMYEIWNEWNMNAKPVMDPKDWLVGPGDKSDPRAAVNYSDLAKAAIPSIRKQFPSVPVIAGAVGVDKDWLWTKGIVEQGVLADATGLSLHLYNQCEYKPSDRTATQAINQLGALHDMLLKQRGGTETPIYVTETGWPTETKPCYVSKDQAANNVAQFLLWSAASSWVKGAWIYQLKDQSRDANAMEGNFGLYDYDYNPKPAACAMRNAIKLIKGTNGYRTERPFDHVFVIQLATAKGMRLIGWTTDETVKAKFSLGDNSAYKAEGLCSGAIKAKGDLIVGPEPVIIDIPNVERVKLDVEPV